jgi:hypothetical protein
MKMNSKFEALVKQLDGDALDQLRRSLELEVEGRAGVQEQGVPIDSIRPGMSAEEKEQAMQEIARVLRERD